MLIRIVLQADKVLNKNNKLCQKKIVIMYGKKPKAKAKPKLKSKTSYKKKKK